MMTLLFIEDNEMLCECSTQFLNNEIPELQIETADSCEGALQKARQWKPELVILDWLLPDGNGLRLLGELSSLLPEFKAIVVSGELESVGALEDLERHVIARMNKPYHMDELATNVRSGLKEILQAKLSKLEEISSRRGAVRSGECSRGQQVRSGECSRIPTRGEESETSRDDLEEIRAKGLQRQETIRRREAFPRNGGWDRHRAINRLSALLAGLRAFGADLRSEAGNEEAVHELVDEYLARLLKAVQELTEMVQQTKKNPPLGGN